MDLKQMFLAQPNPHRLQYLKLRLIAQKRSLRVVEWLGRSPQSGTAPVCNDEFKVPMNSDDSGGIRCTSRRFQFALHERSQRRLAKSPLASDKRSDREQVKLILEFAAGFGFRVVHRRVFVDRNSGALCSDLDVWLIVLRVVVRFVRSTPLRLRMLVVCSSHRQQVCVAWRKHIVLHKPKCLIAKPPAHSRAPVFLHELAEIIGIDDVCFRSGGGEKA